MSAADSHSAALSLAGLGRAERGRLLLGLRTRALYARACALAPADAPAIAMMTPPDDLGQPQLGVTGLMSMALSMGAPDLMKAYMAEGTPEVGPEAAAARAAAGFVDYFGGACIKCDLSGDGAEPRLFDRDAGPGAFAEVLAALRRRLAA